VIKSHNIIALFPDHLSQTLLAVRYSTEHIRETETQQPARRESGRLQPPSTNLGEDRLNEKNIQQVLEIEKRARAAYEQAINEAKEIPRQADQESQLLIEKARAEAEAQARKLIESAQSEDESARILSQANENVRRSETVAARNFDRAVSELLCRVVGKE
jgi:vacuolar-type H+-ATPase subunit H